MLGAGLGCGCGYAHMRHGWHGWPVCPPPQLPACPARKRRLLSSSPPLNSLPLPRCPRCPAGRHRVPGGAREAAHRVAAVGGGQARGDRGARALCPGAAGRQVRSAAVGVGMGVLRLWLLGAADTGWGCHHSAASQPPLQLTHPLSLHSAPRAPPLLQAGCPRPVCGDSGGGERGAGREGGARQDALRSTLSWRTLSKSHRPCACCVGTGAAPSARFFCCLLFSTPASLRLVSFWTLVCLFAARSTVMGARSGAAASHW